MGSACPKANRHENMSFFDGGPVPILIGQKLHVMKHEP
jgi:hypothetical protein